MATPIRIFYLITELDPGGAERALFRLVTGLDRRRYELVVGCLSGRGAVGRALERRGVEVVYFHMRGLSDGAAVTRVAAELRRLRPHLVHTFLFHANLVGRLAAWLARAPRVICSVRVEEPRRLHLLLDRWTQRLMAVEACVSESTRRFTLARAHIAAEKLVVVPNGLDPAWYDVPAPDHLDLPLDRPLVAAIGRLDAQKDPLTFVRAAAMVCEQRPDALFAWAGEGPLRGEAGRLAAALGVSPAVRFLGYQGDVRPLLRRCALLALSSQWEGLPNVVLEAMACRRAVVATDVGGCRELVRDRETGLLSPPGDAEALAERIVFLLNDDARRRAMGETGRALLESRYTAAAVARRWEALYQRVLAEESPALL